MLNAFREVENNLAAVQRLAEQREHLQAQRDALAEGLRLATNRYRAGCSSYLEQLDAERGLLAPNWRFSRCRPTNSARAWGCIRRWAAVGREANCLEPRPAPTEDPKLGNSYAEVPHSRKTPSHS